MEWSWKFIFIWGSVLLSLRITHQAADVAMGGVAVQSTLKDSWPSPDVVIDGKLHTTPEQKSCSSTKRQDNPWWRLDLRGLYYISTIEVTRRTDCCYTGLQGAEIRVGNSLQNDGNDNPRCGVISVTRDASMLFDCSNMAGHYVNIVIPRENRILQLCEVKVIASTNVKGANVAMGGDAVQSSTNGGSPAKLANDGKFRGCASTKWQDNPWWRLDLRGLYYISTIEVTRRTDCCSNLIRGAEIRIGGLRRNNGNDNPRCAVIDDIPKPTMVFNCRRMTGQFVNIIIPHENRILQLCEVKVFATTHIKGENVALTGIATQSAEAASQATAPHMALYPFPSTCASVPLQNNPWWRVDLLDHYYITAVSVISTDDNSAIQELNGAEIRVGYRTDVHNSRCAIISTAQGQRRYSYRCRGMEGRYVYILLPGQQKNLTLCEVRVYGIRRDMERRSVVRISTHFDMSDPVLQQQILKQLEAEMKKKGITDVKIRWMRSFKQEENSQVAGEA